jgi:DNA-binding transcriptional ArsR family regulator
VDDLTQDQDELTFIFDRAAQYFSLLSEPARLRIIQAVCTDERSVQDVVDLTSLPQPNVSRHLSMLYRAGVLSRRREGTFVFYKISDPMITDLCRSVCVRLAMN